MGQCSKNSCFGSRFTFKNLEFWFKKQRNLQSEDGVFKKYQATQTDSVAACHMLHHTKARGSSTVGQQAMSAQCSMVTRSRNHCCHGSATMCFICIVVNSHVAVSNLKPFSVVMETQWISWILYS
jgi:hypothetical protein